MFAYVRTTKLRLLIVRFRSDTTDKNTNSFKYIRIDSVFFFSIDASVVLVSYSYREKKSRNIIIITSRDIRIEKIDG